MKTFKELREAAKDQVVKKLKVGKNQVEITKAKDGKFSVWIGKDKLDDGFASEKEAVSAARDFIKLMGEEA